MKTGLQIPNGLWTPKCSQKPPQMNQKCHQNPLCFRICFHLVFLFIFGCFLAYFDRRPTLDLIGIYNKFVGCSIFRKAWKSNQNDLQQYTKNPLWAGGTRACWHCARECGLSCLFLLFVGCCAAGFLLQGQPPRHQFVIFPDFPPQKITLFFMFFFKLFEKRNLLLSPSRLD